VIYIAPESTYGKLQPWIQHRARPVEHQLHRIPKALTGQATEQAMGARMADSTQVYITYDGWNMKVLVF